MADTVSTTAIILLDAALKQLNFVQRTADVEWSTTRRGMITLPLAENKFPLEDVLKLQGLINSYVAANAAMPIFAQKHALSLDAYDNKAGDLATSTAGSVEGFFVLKTNRKPKINLVQVSIIIGEIGVQRLAKQKKAEQKLKEKRLATAKSKGKLTTKGNKGPVARPEDYFTPWKSACPPRTYVTAQSILNDILLPRLEALSGDDAKAQTVVKHDIVAEIETVLDALQNAAYTSGAESASLEKKRVYTL